MPPAKQVVFYYDAVTSEYMGWSDEYINIGVSMPRHSTYIDPGNVVVGNVAVFDNGEWVLNEDHRGDAVYSIMNGISSTVDYIGLIKDGYTSIAPLSPYAKWDGKKWVTDTDAWHAADVETADQQNAYLLVKAQEAISLWQTELQLGIISDDDKASLILWLQYIKKIQAVDVTTAPNIVWPAKP